MSNFSELMHAAAHTGHSYHWAACSHCMPLQHMFHMTPNPHDLAQKYELVGAIFIELLNECLRDLKLEIAPL